VKRILVLLAAIAAVAVLIGLVSPRRASGQSTPIRHIVYIILENHSFDNLLGVWCVQNGRCNGAMSGQLQDGETLPLYSSPDNVWIVGHDATDQTLAIDGGKMDGYEDIASCGATSGPPYRCYSQYQPSQEPNMIAAADQFVVEDSTFEDGEMPSWGSHLSAVAANTDGFDAGGIPFIPQSGTTGPGWGCDSGRVINWTDPTTGTTRRVPSCVPDYSLSNAQYPNGGAFEPTPVPHIPTIMDELTAAGLSWRYYSGMGGVGSQASGNQYGYGWDACAYFAQCLYTNEHQHNINNDRDQALTDIEASRLADFTIITPTQVLSEHNGDSMAEGDNWLGQLLNAIENCREWNSTAVFVTWDDFGGFYDHVVPPAGLGLRVPLLIISPYAKPGYTDSTPAQFASILKYTEETFGLPAMSSEDANAYDFANAFDYSRQPRHPNIRAVVTPIPQSEIQYLKAHPAPEDDPT
jgi:phospholipase C